MSEQNSLRVVIEGYLIGNGYDQEQIESKDDFKLFQTAMFEAWQQGYKEAEEHYSCES